MIAAEIGRILDKAAAEAGLPDGCFYALPLPPVSA